MFLTDDLKFTYVKLPFDGLTFVLFWLQIFKKMIKKKGDVLPEMAKKVCSLRLQAGLEASLGNCLGKIN